MASEFTQLELGVLQLFDAFVLGLAEALQTIYADAPNPSLCFVIDQCNPWKTDST